jgi:anti-sigma factor RsiW
MGERVTEAELHAYVDGQLDTADRIEVEAYLQEHPEAAALIMEELKRRDEIRLFLAEEAQPASDAALGLARRLEQRLGWWSIGLRLRRGLAAACLVGVGWLAHMELGGLLVDPVAAAPPVPAFVDEAVEAYRALRLELGADHVLYPAVMSLAAERAGGLVLVPPLPEKLRLLGSELVPWDGGVALLVLYAVDDDGLVTLFAAETDSFGMSAPQVGADRELTTVFWQAGHFAYVLSGDLSDANLLAIARQAARWPQAGTPNRLSQPHGDALHG